MNQNELNNYLPFQMQYRNKHTDACPLFYGDLVLADDSFRILAERGPSFEEGDTFPLTDVNKRFVFKTLTETHRAVLRQRSRIVLISGELLPAELYVILVPNGERNAVAGALSYLAEARGIVLSSAARKAAEKGITDEGVQKAENEMALLDGILRCEAELSLLELCERVAYYAGCHVQFGGALLHAGLPALRSERVRLTAFLLCLFLLLRKTDPDGAELILGDGGDLRRVLLRSRIPLSEAVGPAYASVLRHPAFAGFELRWEKR
ncbi:MAG TPA: hypothetical protein DDW30_09180 [Clostridiales bacterium]|nr:hypothetical protein [Clostridiales bacterium]